MKRCICLVAVLLAMLATGCGAKGRKQLPAVLKGSTFAELKPGFDQLCGRCHVDETKGRYSMQSLETVLAGGKSGVAIAPGNAANSLFYKMVAQEPGVRSMPPKASLAPEDVAAIKAWIDAGAE